MTAVARTDAFGPGRRSFAAAAAGLLLAHAGLVHAELGGDAASVQREAQRVNGAVQVTSFTAYDLHEMRAPNGATVRQYLDHGGRVFAVTWRCQGPADLRTLLGSSYVRYRELGASRIDLHHAALHAPDLVVEVGGMLRSFTGRAYVPGQLPAGVGTQEIH
jgi:hypothetical protein